MARTDRIVRAYLRRRFVVTMKSGSTFEGLLLEADDRSLRLIEASAITPKGERVKADGELFLPRGDVDYMQLPPVTVKD